MAARSSPGAARPPPPGRRCRGPAASRPGTRSAAGGGSWSTATSQVMSCVPRRVERTAAPLVAAVRAHPLRPGPLGQLARWWTRSRARRPGPRPGQGDGVIAPRPRRPPGAGLERRPAASTPGPSRRHEDLDEVVAVERRRAPRPTRRRVRSSEAEGQVVEQLVGEDDARTRQARQVTDAHHDRSGAAAVGALVLVVRSGSWRRRTPGLQGQVLGVEARWAAERSTST